MTAGAGNAGADVRTLVGFHVLDLDEVDAGRLLGVPKTIIALAKRLRKAAMATLADLPAARAFREHAERAASAASAAVPVRQLARQLARQLMKDEPTVQEWHLVAALMQIHFMSTDGSVNEYTLRCADAALHTLASGAVECDVSHVPAADRTPADGTDTDRKPDAAVRAGGDVYVFVREVSASRKPLLLQAHDRSWLTGFAILSLDKVASSNDEHFPEAYCFTQQIVDKRITTHVLLPLAYKCLLRIKLNDCDLSNEHFGAPELIGFVSMQLAVRACIDSLRDGRGYVDLVGSAKLPPRPSGGDDRDDDDDDGDDDDDDDDDRDDDKRSIRIRVLLDADLRRVAQRAAPIGKPINTPSKPSKRELAIALAQRDIVLVKASFDADKGLFTAVMQNSKHVFKLLGGYEESDMSRRDNEQKIHQLLTRTCSDVIMPLVGSLVAEAPAHVRSQLRHYGEGIVLVMERANGGHPVWDTMSNADLLVRGDELLAATGRMHALGIVHVDLKPGNIVVHNGTLRVIDYGSAVVVDLFDQVSEPLAPAFTEGFAAPEVGFVMRVAPAVDLYSVGCVLALTPAAKTCAPLAALVASLTARSASQRPSAAQALETWRSSVQPALLADQKGGPPTLMRQPLAAISRNANADEAESNKKKNEKNNKKNNKIEKIEKNENENDQIANKKAPTTVARALI